MLYCSEAKYDIYSRRFIGIEQVALPPSGGTHDLLKQRETYGYLLWKRYTTAAKR